MESIKFETEQEAVDYVFKKKWELVLHRVFDRGTEHEQKEYIIKPVGPEVTLKSKFNQYHQFYVAYGFNKILLEKMVTEHNPTVEHLILGESVFMEVSSEMKRQIEIHGDNHSMHPLEWGSILSEETGEVSKEINNITFTGDRSAIGKLSKELIQVAAVTVSFIKGLDRNHRDYVPLKFQIGDMVYYEGEQREVVSTDIDSPNPIGLRSRWNKDEVSWVPEKRCKPVPLPEEGTEKNLVDLNIKDFIPRDSKLF